MSAPRASVAVAAPKVGQRVSVSVRNGTVCFVGTTSFAEGTWVGIELDDRVGKNDGSVKGKQYFTCKPNHGIFVRPAQVGPPVEEARGPRKSVAAKASAASASSDHGGESPGKDSPIARKSVVPGRTTLAPPEASAASPARRKSFQASGSLETPQGSPSNRNSSIDTSEPPPPEALREFEKLQAEHKDVTRQLSEIRKRKEQANQEAETLEVATTSGGSGQAEEFRRQAKEEHQAAAKLREEQEKASAKCTELQRESSDLEKQAEKIKTEGLMDKKMERELHRLHSAIEVATVENELAKLKAEELQLQLDEARVNYEGDKADAAAADAADPKKLTEEEKAQLHREAMMKVYEDHQIEMRALRKRVADLERAQKQLHTQGSSREEDAQRLQRSIEQLSQDCEALESTANLARQACDERIKLRDANREMTEEHEKLESMLTEELERGLKRERQLEALALQLCQGREDLKVRRQGQRAAVMRLEARLQGLKSQAESMPAAPSQPTLSTGDVQTAELDVCTVAANARVDAVRAEAWAACLPESVCEDAELGDSFQTLCALHRCFHKAQILTSCIHDHYVEDTTFSLQPESGAATRWLCRICLVSAQCAYAAVGILGRLHTLDIKRYVKVIRMPAIRSTSSSETALDQALSVLTATDQIMFGRTPPPEVLTALGALNAQLLSLLRSVFKDESFASWQSAGCAVEALRAVCAFALYASDDAGGSRRNQWQRLFARADRIVRRLAARSRGGHGEQRGLLDIDPAISAQQPTAPKELQVVPGGTQADAAGHDENPQQAPTEPIASEPAGTDGVLSQAMLDGMLVQVSALESFAVQEPGEDDRAADALDRALAQADATMDALEEASRAIAAEDPVAAAAKATTLPPWVQRRNEMRAQIEEADATVMAEKSHVEAELNRTDKQLKTCDDRIATVEREVTEVEKQFSIARIDAERFELVRSTVARMRNQAQYHDAKQASLRDELKREEERRKRVKREIEETHHRCKELEQQLGEYEKRMQKRYSTNVSPEEVIALRQTCSRQQREMMAFQRKGAAPAREPIVFESNRGKSTWGKAMLKLGKSNLGSHAQTGEEKNGISAKELSSCWQRLREIQTGLLFEHADSDLVDLSDTGSKQAVDEKSRRLDDLARQSADLKGSVTALLREVAGVDDNGGGLGASFASVALTRHLKSTTEAVARGPLAKMKLPGAADGTELNLKMPVLADFDQIKSMHRALL